MSHDPKVKRITLLNEDDVNFDSSKPVYGIRIGVDGRFEVVNPKKLSNGYTLDEMQSVVGGYVELHTPTIRIEILQTKIKNGILIFDADGQMKAKPINLTASGLCNEFLAGDVFIIDSSMWR